ncbi:MAG: response regulator [candidate division WOR-3 bacterium]|nr:response regulator [candidate division WOR-3 bacterium]
MAKRVLMVDDDPEFVETTKIILESGGYETRTAANGNEALAQLQKEKPDIILLDVMMKTIGDGVWLGQKIKGDERFSGIPILMITAVNKESGASSFHLDPNADGDYLPVDGFLEKPVEPEVLLREVARLIKL